LAKSKNKPTHTTITKANTKPEHQQQQSPVAWMLRQSAAYKLQCKSSNGRS